MSGAGYKGMDPVKVSGAVTPSCYADRSLFAWAGLSPIWFEVRLSDTEDRTMAVRAHSLPPSVQHLSTFNVHIHTEYTASVLRRSAAIERRASGHSSFSSIRQGTSCRETSRCIARLLGQQKGLCVRGGKKSHSLRGCNRGTYTSTDKMSLKNTQAS